MISVVGNRQGELLCRLDLFAPRRERFEGLPLLEEAGAEAALDLESLRQEVMTEIKAKVRMRLPMPPLIGHEGVVGLISDPGYEVAIEPGEEGSAGAFGEKRCDELRGC